jgi:isochorismate synthase
MPGSSGSAIYTGKIKQINLKDAFNLQGFILAPFITSPQNPVIFLEPDAVSEDLTEIPDWLIDQVQLSDSFTETGLIFNTEKGNYRVNLEKLIELLKSGKANKVVISRTTVIECVSNLQLIQLYDALCKEYPHAFIYLAHIPPFGIWIGATPETLISCHDRECRTMALAGTRLVGSEKEWGEKEKEEQAIVSRFILDRLEIMQVKNLKVSEPFTKRAGQIEHLCTSFEFELSEQSSLSALVAELHPTPAVCGFPKDDALQLINQFETHDRGYYSGFLGPVNYNGKTDLFVNLRCMKITVSKMILFAGGGITKDSVPEKEWEETELKTQTLLSVIEPIRGK